MFVLGGGDGDAVLVVKQAVVVLARVLCVKDHARIHCELCLLDMLASSTFGVLQVVTEQLPCSSHEQLPSVCTTTNGWLADCCTNSYLVTRQDVRF
jgi:hypothetical protein